MATFLVSILQHLVVSFVIAFLSPLSNTLGCPYPRRSGLHSRLSRCVVGLKLSVLAPPSATRSFIGLTLLRPIGFPPSDQYRIPVSTLVPMTDFPSFAPLVSGKVHIVDATCVATLATHYSFFPIFDIGIPQTNRSKGYPEMIAYAEPLFNIMPGLPKHFYRVLHNLVIYPYTPDFVMRMRYLRIRESFSAASWPHSLSSFPTSRSGIPTIQESWQR
ncbi:hypothetical protein EDB92DRAFT_1972247 [Lactarius akahatsu]|uniref:Uncharacterized protein n=1 Tax=Lactarius akahatsu TaxID=416441 RepID=A0AAD4Q8U2_9AGAM|nr:hypothetical protein EDB92DRAFT_1972247 [Lactarius akahatsu]